MVKRPDKIIKQEDLVSTNTWMAPYATSTTIAAPSAWTTTSTSIDTPIDTSTYIVASNYKPLECPDIEAIAASGQLDTQSGREEFVKSFEAYLKELSWINWNWDVWKTDPPKISWAPYTSDSTATITYSSSATPVVATTSTGTTTLCETPSTGTWNVNIDGRDIPVTNGSITTTSSGETSFSGTTPLYNDAGVCVGECVIEVPHCTGIYYETRETPDETPETPSKIPGNV